MKIRCFLSLLASLALTSSASAVIQYYTFEGEISWMSKGYVNNSQTASDLYGLKAGDRVSYTFEIDFTAPGIFVDEGTDNVNQTLSDVSFDYFYARLVSPLQMPAFDGGYFDTDRERRAGHHDGGSSTLQAMMDQDHYVQISSSKRLTNLVEGDLSDQSVTAGGWEIINDQPGESLDASKLYQEQFYMSFDTLSISDENPVVPEPSTYGLIAGLGASLLVLRRRLRRAAV